jgi:hypothetical protein
MNGNVIDEGVPSVVVDTHRRRWRQLGSIPACPRIKVVNRDADAMPFPDASIYNLTNSRQSLASVMKRARLAAGPGSRLEKIT